MKRRQPARQFTRLQDYGPDAPRRAAKGRPRRKRIRAGAVPLALAAALAFGLIGSGLVDEATGGDQVIRAEAARPNTNGIRTSFGFCADGGSRNCVVDGDTFRLGGEKIRIAGIDAPETHQSRCADEKALGDQATERLHALLNSGTVRLQPIDRDRDRYGRLLRDVSVDGRDVGATLIDEGVVRPYGSGRRSWCG